MEKKVLFNTINIIKMLIFLKLLSDSLAYMKN